MTGLTRTSVRDVVDQLLVAARFGIGDQIGEKPPSTLIACIVIAPIVCDRTSCNSRARATRSCCETRGTSL